MIRLSKSHKLIMLKRLKKKVQKYRGKWEYVNIHTRLMIIHARIAKSLNSSSRWNPTWEFLLMEWRKKLKNPFYIMETIE
jgi:hypothetical protein